MPNYLQSVVSVIFRTDTAPFKRVVDLFTSLSVKFTTSLVTILISIIFIKSIIGSDYIIQPFSIPPGLEEDGYSGHILSQEIINEVNVIADAIRKMRAEELQQLDSVSKSDKLISEVSGISFSNGLENLDVEVMGLGISVDKFSNYLRTALGLKTPEISGELIFKGEVIGLNVRVTGHRAISLINDEAGDTYARIESLKKEAALAINRILRPVELAYYNYQLKDYEKAIESCDHAISLHTEKEYWAHFIKAQSHFKKSDRSDEDTEAGFEHFAKSVDLRSSFAEAWYYWGHYLYKEKRYEEAIEKFEQAEQITDRYAAVYLYWGQALVDMDRFAEGIEMYKKALEIEKDNYYIYYCIAFDMNKMGEYEQAITYYREAIRLNPKKISYYLNLADIYSIMDDHAAALMVLEDARIEVQYASNQQEIYKKYATTSLWMGNEEDAISFWTQYLIWKEDNDYYKRKDYSIINDILIEAEQFSYGYKIVERYQKMVAGNQVSSTIWANLAYYQNYVGDFEGAIKTYNQAGSVSSKFEKLGDNYKALSQYDEALKYYQSQQNYNGADRQLYLKMGYTALAMGNVELACEYMIKARKISVVPSDELLEALGVVSLHQGMTDKAQSYFYQAYRRTMNNEAKPLIIAEYINILEQLGQDDQIGEIAEKLAMEKSSYYNSTVSDIYKGRGKDVTLKYLETLLKYTEKKGRVYSLFALTHALENDQASFTEYITKSKNEGFPVEYLASRVPFKKFVN